MTKNYVFFYVFVIFTYFIFLHLPPQFENSTGPSELEFWTRYALGGVLQTLCSVF